jgi:uncharacterized protein YyaL (SSP411 family)
MPNRLAREASPYLQQHAHNPVDWYPWGEEALARARAEDKPILLSIGYSACHWCHVMERESFESEAVAKLMNEWFVSVKVDREERPDLDQVYQLVVQLMGRSGGWPLTVFLTPDQKPFFGGTYFPPVDRFGMPGFPKVLQAVWEAYHARRGEVDAQSEELSRAIANVAAPRAEGDGEGASLGTELIAEAGKKLASRFDREHGGFGRRPKFPNTMALDLLARAGHAELVREALDAMRAGGIWDHLGGGFHRYSTDERWLVPHFEKMLYDNALLLRLYADGFRIFGDDRYADTARAIAAYVEREMTSPGGGFYATQDADSQGEEGKFFVWTPGQVDAACGHDVEAARAAKRVWGIDERGNFEESGATVLSMVEAPRDAAEAEALERARRAMLAERELRPRPLRDEKVLACWNGLMIGALADAGAALGEGRLVELAARAMRDVEQRLVVRTSAPGAGTRVERHYKGDDVKGPGFLDDYAYLGDAAIDLYEATGDAHWVGLARALADAILARFHDASGGGFFFVADDAEKILVRAKDAYDHATPSASSVAARLLLRLGALVDPKYAPPGEEAVRAAAAMAAENPMGMSSVLCLADRLVRGSVDVVLVGPRTSDATRALARTAARAPVSDRVLAWADPADPVALEACAALAEGKPARPEPSAFVCRGRACSLPVTQPEALARLLAKP